MYSQKGVETVSFQLPTEIDENDNDNITPLSQQPSLQPPTNNSVIPTTTKPNIRQYYATRNSSAHSYVIPKNEGMSYYLFVEL